MSMLLITWEYLGFSKAMMSYQMSQEAYPCSLIFFLSGGNNQAKPSRKWGLFYHRL